MCIEAEQLISEMSAPLELPNPIVRKIRQWKSTRHVRLTLTFRWLVINREDGYKRYQMDFWAVNQDGFDTEVLERIFYPQEWPLLTNEDEPMPELLDFLFSLDF